MNKPVTIDRVHAVLAATPAPVAASAHPQSLLDLRVSRTISFGSVGRIDVLLDVLNVLNDTAGEALAKW